MVRCLVVDDNPNNRLVARYILEDLQCDVMDADSAQAAARILEQQAIDVVLLDWMMPQMDGVAFLTSLRSDPQHAALKVVMCSAKEGDASVAIALQAGANAYLPKPITFDDAQALLKKLGF